MSHYSAPTSVATATTRTEQAFVLAVTEVTTQDRACLSETSGTIQGVLIQPLLE